MSKKKHTGGVIKTTYRDKNRKLVKSFELEVPFSYDGEDMTMHIIQSHDEIVHNYVLEQASRKVEMSTESGFLDKYEDKPTKNKKAKNGK